MHRPDPKWGSEARTDALRGSYDMQDNQVEGRTRDTQRPPKGIPPEWTEVLERNLAPNGLAYRKQKCSACGYHLWDDGVLMGIVRKKCPNCKYPNEVEYNRVGDQEQIKITPPKREGLGRRLWLRMVLAAYAHTAWSGWMRYLFSKCVLNQDGSATIPTALVTRWTRQLSTAYTDLPESEQASDLLEADKMLFLAEQNGGFSNGTEEDTSRPGD